MNANPKETLSLAITGVLTLQRTELEQLLGRVFAHNAKSEAPVLRNLDSSATQTRMSFTVAQTAELLGIGNATVYRLFEQFPTPLPLLD